MAEDKPEIPGGTSRFLQNLGALTGIVVALAGLVGSYYGYVAKSEAEQTTTKLNAESEKLKALQARFDESERFAGDIAQGRDAMARNNANVKAMIEYVSLYAASDNVDRKYLLVETAQAANDPLSLNTLGALMIHDDAIQHPSTADAEKVRVIKQTLNSATREAYNRGTPRSASAGFNDARLGAVANPVAAANGQVVAALTQVGSVGWVFVGDVLSGRDGPLIGDLVSPTRVPEPKTRLKTSAELNLRSSPPASSGKLGEIFGVAPAGSVLYNIEPARRFAFISRANNGEKRDAIWIYARLDVK